jgi:tRNA A-37 threonylcarbamoyl transferase component Bud32
MREEYKEFNRNRVQGICAAELEPHLAFFTEGFEAWLTSRPTRIFLERPNRVVGLQLPPGIFDVGTRVVVKRFGWRSPLHRLVRPLTGSKAIRSFRIAMTLWEAGLATPRPLIAWDRKGGGTAFESYYITEEIPDAVTLRQILKSVGGLETDKSTLWTELARLVRGMHDAGILHRDLTIGNFLVAPKPADGNRIFIIDLSRAIHLGRVPLLLRFVDLARMKLGDLWPDFFAAYCTGRPNWKAQRPILNFLIRLRRWKMDFRKKMKGRDSR